MLKLLNDERSAALSDEIYNMLRSRDPFFDERMFYFTGDPVSVVFKSGPEARTNDIDSHLRNIEYAVLDPADNSIIGYFTYSINIYMNCAARFSVISFKPSMVVINDVIRELEMLAKRLHRIEWSVISGNKVEKFYNKFCTEHNGSRIVLHDAVRDMYGNYHDSIIYEIINNGGVK